jgi:PAS domain S-box-containing protein
MSGFAARQVDSAEDLRSPFLKSHGRTAAYALLVSVAYYVAARIGFDLTFQPYPVSALWPPNAVLLSALLLAPRRLWFILLLAAFPAHLAVELESGVPISMILCWFISNCAEALIGAICLWSFIKGPPRFDRFLHVSAFIGFAIFATFISSFLDAAFVTLLRWGERSYWQVWQMRMFSNVLAQLTLVPAIITVAVKGFAHLRSATIWRMAEAGLFGIGLTLTAIIAFGNQNSQSGIIPALVYAPLPFLLWAAVRFGPRAVSMSLLAVALLAIKSAMEGRGPFTSMSQAQNALSLQLFLIVMTVPLLLLAAIIQERRETEHALRASQKRYELATAAGGVGVWERNLELDQVCIDPTITRILGYTADEWQTQAEWQSRTHPDDIKRVETARRAVLQGIEPVFDMEYRMFHKDGSVRWIASRWAISPDFSGDGPGRILGTIADITNRKRAEETLRNSEEALRESNQRIRDLAGRLIAAQEEERKRIARDLHDDLNQQMAALSIGLSKLKRQIAEPVDPRHDEIIMLQERAADVIAKIRELSHDLHSTILEHIGLPEALKSLCEEFRSQRGININLRTSGEIATIPSDVELCLYRVVQESLQNVARHSGAKCAEVTLAGTGHFLELSVTDEGVGFDSENLRPHDGLGLISMQERIHLLHGDLQIKAQPGRGTELRARLPIRKSENQDGPQSWI